MAIEFNILTEAAYQNLRYALIKQLEEGGSVSLTPYVDSVGIPTTGLGFNLSANLASILKVFEFAIDPKDVNYTKDKPYIDQLQAIVNRTTYASSSAGKTKLQADLNRVMVARAANANIPGVKRSSFAFNNEVEVQAVFNTISEKYDNAILSWKNKYSLSEIPLSAERAVIFSFAYNTKSGGSSLLGAGLAKALRDGKRAEAWYEIRYNSNGGASASSGIAKRRLIESEIFGLYKNGASPANNDEAFNAYQMFTAHRSDILSYENSYKSQIAQANLELAEAKLTQYRVKSLEDELQPAATLLSTTYGNGQIFDPLSIQAASSEMENISGDKNSKNKNDLLLGDNADNNLKGGSGDDLLIGGLGADILDGGSGNDTFIIDNAADKVIEKSGQGKDRVISSLTSTSLFAFTEELILTGSAISGTGNSDNNFIQGNAQNNTLNGNAGDDILDAGLGADILDGGAGADQLRGGAGFDTYKVSGNDTIIDSDGLGKVLFGNIQAIGGKETEKGSRIYISDDKKFTYTKFDSQVIIKSAAETVLVKGWSSSKNLGIILPGEPDRPIPSGRDNFHKGEDAKSPLILDLNGDGVKTLDLSAEVHFDHDNNQFAELSGWADKNDGFLVLDKNANGKIDSGAELFGSNTVLSNGNKADNGFSALAELDSNADGVINSSDIKFSMLRVWKDANSNGVTDEKELLSLSAAGVKSINVNYSASDLIDPQNNAHKQTSTYTTTSGATRAIDDVWFDVDLAYTQELNNLSISDEIAALPDLQGFGNIHSLHQAMARDAELITLVKQWTAAEPDSAVSDSRNPPNKIESMKDEIYSWQLAA